LRPPAQGWVSPNTLSFRLSCEDWMSYLHSEPGDRSAWNVRLLYHMKFFYAILFGAIGVMSIGCHRTDSADSDARYRAWLLSAIKEEAASHHHVLLVGITESHPQRRPYGYYQLVDSEGTLVRCYKGDWKPGERILLHEEFESVAKDWKPPIRLRFILTDKQTSDRIDIDAEDRWDYQPEFDRALQLACSNEAKP
jgi:hypothetical protein